MSVFRKVSRFVSSAAPAFSRSLATRPAFDDQGRPTDSWAASTETSPGESPNPSYSDAPKFRGINRVELYGYIGGVYPSLTSRNTDALSIMLNIPGEAHTNPDGSRYMKPSTTVIVRSFSATHYGMYRNGALAKGHRAVIFGSLHGVTYEKGTIDPATNAELLQNTRKLFVNAERIIAIPRSPAPVPMHAQHTTATPTTATQEREEYDADYDDK